MNLINTYDEHTQAHMRAQSCYERMTRPDYLRSLAASAMRHAFEYYAKGDAFYGDLFAHDAADYFRRAEAAFCAAPLAVRLPSSPRNERADADGAEWLKAAAA